MMDYYYYFEVEFIKIHLTKSLRRTTEVNVRWVFIRSVDNSFRNYFYTVH